MSRSIQNIIRATPHYESTTGVTNVYLTLYITISILGIYTYSVQIVEIIFVYRSSKTCNVLLHCCTKLRHAFPLSYLRTYSTEQNPSWEASRFSATQEFPAFYGTRTFITTFTSAPHLSLSSARSMQSMLPDPNSWRSLLILSSIYARVFQVVSVPQVSPPKPCIHLYSPP